MSRRICEFLGVSVSDGDFPRVNETKAAGDRVEVCVKLEITRALGGLVIRVVGFRRGWFEMY